MVDPVEEIRDALANLVSFDYEPEQDQSPARLREREWATKCTKHSSLIKLWHTGQISRSLLREYNGVRQTPRAFNIPQTIYQAVFENRISKIDGLVDLHSCTGRQFERSLRLLLQVEEAHHAIEMRRLDLTNKRLTVYESNAPAEEHRRRVLDMDDLSKMFVSYGLTVPGLSNLSQGLVVPDYAIVYSELINPALAVAFQISSIRGDSIVLPNNGCNRFARPLRQPVSVAFISSGAPFRYCEQAVRELSSNRAMRRIVHEDIGQPLNRVNIDMVATSTPELEDRMRTLNDSQRRSVIGILEAKCWPKPYILFGPPGTGKTRTLIEAIVQVYHRSRIPMLDDPDDYYDDLDYDYLSRPSTPDAQILVCVNSNTCTNDIFEMLGKELPGVKIARLSAGDHQDKVLDDDIVVATNTKAGCLNGRRKFNYVFVDEAGHANLPESLIPLALLSDYGVLVLAGDPKQLGPVVMCRPAGELGLNISLLERLFAFEIYQRDSLTGSYDSNYITMLNDCYRCDGRIMRPCNRLFYQDELNFINETPGSLLRMLKLTSPLQFMDVTGCEDQFRGSTSWRNLKEAAICVDIITNLYRMGVEPGQIGVATPYTSQQMEIRAKLRTAMRVERAILGERFPEQVYTPRQWSERSLQFLKQFDLAMPHEQQYEKVGDLFIPFSMETYTNGPRLLYETECQPATDRMCKVDSIDSFQGDEREIMIISTVRTSSNLRRLEFLNDSRRFNVAVSRAKWLAIVVGREPVLKLGEYWPQLIESSKSELGAWMRKNV